MDTLRGFAVLIVPLWLILILFHAYLQNRFYNDLLSVIETQLPSLQDWFIGTGANPVSGVADTRPAFMLGDTPIDQFTGSSQNDLIITGAGNDMLDGGEIVFRLAA